MILGLDLGINTGWARSDGRSGVFSVKGLADHGEALARFSDWVEAMLDEAPLVCLAIERGFGGNNAVGRLTTAMELTAHMHAYTRCIPRTDRGADEVRKWLVGQARISSKVEPSKAQRTRDMDKLVLAGVRARGFDPANEHAADACALVCMVEQRMPREMAA